MSYAPGLFLISWTYPASELGTCVYRWILAPGYCFSKSGIADGPIQPGKFIKVAVPVGLGTAEAEAEVVWLAVPEPPQAERKAPANAGDAAKNAARAKNWRRERGWLKNAGELELSSISPMC